MAVLEKIAKQGYLGADELRAFVAEACGTMDLDGKSVLFIIPDQTRSMPMPLVFRALYDAVHGRAKKMDYLIALGTHPPMTDAMIHTLLGITPEERAGKYGDVGIFNHDWKNPEALTRVGVFTEDDIAELSGGLLRQGAEVTLNRRVLEYDLVCIVGPVFPHEVVGFSGGAKYLFPGISGGDFLHFFHWLGAVLTCKRIIGIKDTPVRRLIDRSLVLQARIQRIDNDLKGQTPPPASNPVAGQLGHLAAAFGAKLA